MRPLSEADVPEPPRGWMKLTMSAPPNMPGCQDLTVVMPMRDVDVPLGGRAIISYWRPDPEELALLLAGEPLRLMVFGGVTPPVALDVGAGWTDE